MCRGEIRIMYRWELVEGRDKPKELGSTVFQKLPWKTTMSLMWGVMKPLWVTDNTVIMVSGFSVLREFIGMFGRGFYVISSTNNHRYWPK